MLTSSLLIHFANRVRLFPRNIRSTPTYMIWVKYLSWFNYGNEALMINQWEGVRNLTCTGVKTCFSDGESVLAHLGYSDDDLWWDVCCLVVLIVVYRVVAFLLLLLRTHRGKTRS